MNKYYRQLKPYLIFILKILLGEIICQMLKISIIPIIDIFIGHLIIILIIDLLSKIFRF